MDTKNRILSGSENLFKRFGVRSVSMDDIARDLGMSKKTLYQYFKNKADIVNGVIRCHIVEEEQKHTEIRQQAENPIVEIMLLLKWIGESFEEIPASMVYDIQKYYPRAWNQFEDFKTDFIIEAIRDNLNRGISLGLYRPEMNVEIVAKTRMELVELVFDLDTFPPDQFNLAEVMIEQTLLFMHGIVSLKGKQFINEYLNQTEA